MESVHPNNKNIICSTDGTIKTYYIRGTSKVGEELRECIPFHQGHGYYAVSIACKMYKVHRLIAQTFIPNPENKREVNHKDYDKKNNKSDNLEWSTRSENMLHANANGRLPYTIERRRIVGEKVSKAKKGHTVSLYTRKKISDTLKARNKLRIIAVDNSKSSTS